MKHRFAVLLLLSLFIVGVSSIHAQNEVRVAVARLQDVNGLFVGTVSLTQVNANVVVVA